MANTEAKLHPTLQRLRLSEQAREYITTHLPKSYEILQSTRPPLQLTAILNILVIAECTDAGCLPFDEQKIRNLLGEVATKNGHIKRILSSQRQFYLMASMKLGTIGDDEERNGLSEMTKKREDK